MFNEVFLINFDSPGSSSKFQIRERHISLARAVEQYRVFALQPFQSDAFEQRMVGGTYVAQIICRRAIEIFLQSHMLGQSGEDIEVSFALAFGFDGLALQLQEHSRDQVGLFEDAAGWKYKVGKLGAIG